MIIINSTANATGDWFRINGNAELDIATTNASVFDGCTIAIQVADEGKVQIFQNPDRTYTSGFDDVLYLKEGMHIRAVITGAGASTSVVVAAFPGTLLNLSI